MTKGNVVGKRFGRLVATDNFIHERGVKKWLCVCDCGNQVYVEAAKLNNGNTQSCGCLAREKSSERFYKHGGKAHKERLYSIWKNMNARCNANEEHNPVCYKYYASKGITVCDEWKDYKVFKEWALVNGYTDEKTLDRIDGEGDYCPENCRWCSRVQQQNNISSNKKYDVNGELLTKREIAEKYNLTYDAVSGRLKRGWTIEKIINTPLM